MKPNEIIKEIYETNKDKLESEEQVRLILNCSFSVFKTLFTQAKEFILPNLFIVKWSHYTGGEVGKNNIKRRKIKREWAKNVLRAWTKKIIDEDF